MAIRIEYLLLITVILLVFSIIRIEPSSQTAKSSKGEKEIEFQNFTLSDIKTNEPEQEMYATKLLKYNRHLEMDNIDLIDENGYQLLSTKAIYHDDEVYMDKGVNILNKNGLKLSTKSLNYNVESQEIKTDKPFLLEFNSSIIQGQNLVLNIDSKKVSADNIEGKIVFVSVDKNITVK